MKTTPEQRAELRNMGKGYYEDWYIALRCRECLPDLIDDVEALQRIVERIDKGTPEPDVSLYSELAAENDEYTTEILRLRATLNKYGGHLEWCDTRGCSLYEKCNCGWEEIEGDDGN